MANVTDFGLPSFTNSTTTFSYNLTLANVTTIAMTSDDFTIVTDPFNMTTELFNMTTDAVTMTTEPTTITTEPTTITTEPATMTTEPTTTTTLATTTTIITTLLIACVKPPAISNAIYTFSGYDVIYTCNNGFFMSGASRLDCDVTRGRWINRAPSCSALDLKPDVDNTINIPETKEPIKSSDIQLIVAVIGGLLGLIAFICLLILIAHLCGYRTSICGERHNHESCCCRNERNRRRISNGDFRVFHSNVEHTFYDAENVLMDMEKGGYNLPSKTMLPNSQDTFTKEGSSPKKVVSSGTMTSFHHHIENEIRSNTMDMSHRRGSVDVRSHHDHESSPFNSKIYRAQRKVQAVNSWMPHSKPVRNINTSTK